MRKRTAFRPWFSECLEARAVPAVAVVTLAGPALDLAVSLPDQVQLDDARVVEALDAFDRAFEEAVESVLLAPGPGGRINPFANRAAFDASIQEALDELAEDLVETLEGDSADSALVVDAILGDDPDSLENRLLALPTVAIEPLEVAEPAAEPAGAESAVPLANTPGTEAEPPGPSTLIPIPQGTIAATREARAPTSTASTDVAQKVRKAFGAFLDEYFRAVDGVLLADRGGKVDPESARSSFDARVDRALRGLGDGLYVTLRRNPTASPLAPGVREAIAGDVPSSLKARLKNLDTPDGPQAAVVREFTMGSVKVVAEALSIIAGDVSEALDPR